MSSIRSDIGYLAWLFAFEAAGRLGSFTRAAAELGVTQAAVSKQIVALEDRLGQRLFHRRPRHVELTPAGQELFATTTFALGAIARTMRDLRRVEDPPLTIALSIPLSQFWLMPRLAEFTAAQPQIPVRIIAQDDPATVRGADVHLRYDMFDAAPPAGARRLFGATVMAMASPQFLERHRLATPADVIAAPLIHYDAPDRSWITWRDWAAHCGLAPGPLRPALSVSRYQDALIAAQQHQGIVLVWCIDGRPLVAEGHLLATPGRPLPAPGAFYLHGGDRQRPGLQLLTDWLVSLSDRR